MQILTSGSFVNLDNQEKIDQLIFTAKAIADSATETDGFRSDEANNQRLALEIWQGADYLTREHERARVQNIFVGHFLDRLREIAPAAAPTNAPSETSETAAAATEISSAEPDESKDEFLGFVTTENESLEVGNADEILVKTEVSGSEVSGSDENWSSAVQTIEEIQGQTAEPDTTESAEILTVEASAENSIAETPEIETAQPAIKGFVEAKQEPEDKSGDASPTAKEEKPAFRAISLPEKEPYRFDDCTVTAIVQLLPTSDGKRRAVVSVRTHDFAPQISVVELEGAAMPEKLVPALFASFERYTADLPVKVMDKMKREKSSGKKQASGKTNVETKMVPESAQPPVDKLTQSTVKAVEENVPKPANNVGNSSAPAPTLAPTPAVSPVTNANPAKPGAKTSKVDPSAQGSLFDV